MKQIKFILDPGVPMGITPPPVPAKEMIPEWYRNGEMFINKYTGLLTINDPSERAAGMKACMPYFDAITSGYLMVTWASVEIYENRAGKISWRYVIKDEDGQWVEDPIDHKLIDIRHGDIGYTMPRPAGYAHHHMTWPNRFGMRLPKGWSILCLHPLNRFDLPFMSISAFMDSDRFVMNGNMPFFIKENWTGIIEKGTPYMQLIPVKREAWMASVLHAEKDKLGMHLGNQTRSVQYGYYRSKLWVQKKYFMKGSKHEEE